MEMRMGMPFISTGMLFANIVTLMPRPLNQTRAGGMWTKNAADWPALK